MNDQPPPTPTGPAPDEPTPSGPGHRVYRAARALDLPGTETTGTDSPSLDFAGTDPAAAGGGEPGNDLVWAVAAAGCGLAGAPTPPARPGSAARAVLVGLVRALDQVPVGTLSTPNDLGDAAAHRPGTEVVPAIPQPVSDALAELDTLLAGTTAAGLRQTAGELGLDRDTATVGATLAGPVWPPGELSARPVSALLDGIAVREPERWQRWERDVVAWGLRLMLARIGDALLALTEWPQPGLPWTDWTDLTDLTDRTDAVSGAQDRPQRAFRAVPGAPQPLEAHLEHDPSEPTPAGTAAQGRARAGPLFAGSARPLGKPWAWCVGWRDSVERFRVHSRGHEPSHGAARGAAERVVAALAEQPGPVRLPLSGELLVPRPAGIRSLDARVVDLEALLVATLNEWRGEERDREDGRSPQPWAMRPHRDRVDPDQVGSVLAVVFDHLGLPLPPAGSAADTSDADSTAMTAFLAAEAITLTPLARRYLTGMAAAGPGEQPLEARHRAGMGAVLDDPAAADWLALEVPAHQHRDHRELVGIDTLESLLAPPAV